MNANELRVGNFVKVDDVVVEVVAIQDGGENSIEIKKKEEVIKVWLSDVTIQPITIERDVVVSCCGFDDQGRLLLNIDNSYFHYLKENNGHIILMSRRNEAIIHFWDVKTIHQLQNLVYALKGEEMNICVDLPKMLKD